MTRSIILILSLIACGGPTLTPECGVGIRPCGNDGLYDYDGDGYCEDVDCNEDDCTINPGSAEICDGIDNDCDEMLDAVDTNLTKSDDDELAEYFVDHDGDEWCSHDTQQMCVAYVGERDETVYTDKHGETFVLCQSGRTVEEWGDIPYTEQGFFDCCDDGTEDACVEDILPQCQQPNGDECAADEECQRAENRGNR